MGRKRHVAEQDGKQHLRSTFPIAPAVRGREAIQSPQRFSERRLCPWQVLLFFGIQLLVLLRLLLQLRRQLLSPLLFLVPLGLQPLQSALQLLEQTWWAVLNYPNLYHNP